MYFLTLKSTDPDSETKSGVSNNVPLQMVVNGLDSEHEQYYVSSMENTETDVQTHLELFIDPCEVSPGTRLSESSEISQIKVDNVPSKERVNILSNIPLSTNHAIIEDASPKTKLNCSLSASNTKKMVIEYVHIADRPAVPRAIAVLPSALQLRHDVVSPRRSLPAKTRFGPVKGLKQKVSDIQSLLLKANKTNTPLYLLRRQYPEDSIGHIDVSDKDKSNWFSLLPYGDADIANVFLYEENSELYGITMAPLATRTPLIIGYSKEYAEVYGLPEGPSVYNLNQETKTKSHLWWCHECNRSVTSAALLQRHMDIYHKDNCKKVRRHYRCQHCTKNFSRLFTLKRHITRFCGKNASKQSNQQEVTTDNSCDQQTVVDKLPSDESLQNYTNNLDFSTNLFDTDRMPNLDMSGSSRSDIDFIPYGLQYKDDNGSASGFNCKKKKENENILLNCPHCNETIVREKNVQHLRECPGRRLKCECGRVFISKDSLAKHIYLKHPNGPPDKDSSGDNKQKYYCEECKFNFKRRGMLVNHLVRVHGQEGISLPLERRVRHYPCVACPKVYVSAAKRNFHVRTHHPGLEDVRALSIEGGMRACNPAKCQGCPRQYATRAKLLQHVRQHHPQLAPPKKKTSVKDSEKVMNHTETTAEPMSRFNVDVLLTRT